MVCDLRAYTLPLFKIDDVLHIHTVVYSRLYVLRGLDITHMITLLSQQKRTL